MASRRKSRLSDAGNSLADSIIQLSDPKTGEINETELIGILTSRDGTTVHAPVNTWGSLPPRNVIESDYALESFQLSHHAQSEAVKTKIGVTNLDPTWCLMKTEEEKDVHHYTQETTFTVLEPDNETDPFSIPDDGTNLAKGTTWSSDQTKTPAQELADSPDKSFANKPTVPQYERKVEHGFEGNPVDPALRILSINQNSASVRSPVLLRNIRPTACDHQENIVISRLVELSGRDDDGSTLLHTPSPGLTPARTSDFENHTRIERSLSRAGTHETSPRSDVGFAPVETWPCTSGKAVTQSLEPQMDVSRLLSLLGQDHRPTSSAINLRHENFASQPVITPVCEKLLEPDDQTILIVQDSSTASKHRSYLQKHLDAGSLVPFNYSELYPEVLPTDYKNITYSRSPEEKRENLLRHLAHRLSSITADEVRQVVRSGQLQTILELAKAAWPMFPRVFNLRPFKTSPNAPPICRPHSKADAWPDDIPIDLLEYLATNFLSHADVRNLRLVNRPMSASFSPIYFRTLVTRFGSGMFAPSLRYGDSVNKFGISFEVDLPSLYKAKNKVSQEKQQAWWGDYTWPKPAYQRFPELEALEELVDDNKPLLKKTLQNLPNASELALSIDSGHGWLNGPDLSDMQLWEIRKNGSKVFGKAFKAPDKLEEHLQNELFRWAQQNTIIQSIKYLVERSTTEGPNAWARTKAKLRWLRAVRIRNLENFEIESEQTDHDDKNHAGGPPRPNLQDNAVQNQLGNAFLNGMANPPPQPGAGAAGAAAAQLQLQLQNAQAAQGLIPPALPGTVAPRQRNRRVRPARPRAPSPRRSRATRIPQWPLIYNGYNLAAEVGGENSYVQDKIANPASSPIKPGQLSEAQAQWLMETVWAQRAFLSAYTTSVILNKANLKGVHALNIAKLSSGLLPLLEQHEFWRALPGLRALTIIISPDWRQEHIPGDQSFQSNMLISPINASVKLTSFLERFICHLENLSELTIGFVGGGENAPGMLARNQHVLPAPITEQPRSWISDHTTTPLPQTMISFNHIKDLKFSNCWFSPCMLLAFMEKSRDTSLRHLILDSVSLTAHGASSVNSSTVATPIDAQYGAEAWLNETLPNKGCWPAVLDEMTPGMTFLEQKEALGFHLSGESEQLKRDKSFRGNVQEITLNSCGYASISGLMVVELNQSDLLRSQSDCLDDGLAARKQALQAGQSSPRSRRLQAAQPGNANPPPIPIYDPRPSTPQDISGRLMMGTNDAHGHEYFGLGTLTQAVHPVEKRVLEQAWGMRFGWGNDMKRWSAVDDGFFEGGTGRFSGSVLK